MNDHRAPTIGDVAAAAGVSRSTVSRVINDDEKVSARTRTAVNQAVSDLAYAPNPAARSLARARAGRTRDATAS
ncbi:LacI family DNA-binding transcriptional regulator [Microbacterium sp. zg-YB36]|uniref:LacI family DNA-binding transcriptional regulator n=1 Tax=Microbacterium sp. zg-YB36 TaxID=2969407 RepID=UPI00214BD27C|nr:LacI family DNA-binding transcriptional regulator [Microbacterium sp. zg-YB36]MDL5352726.1 LacI family DNA-binding transcriptional regulator [Microbacterium sp. zg-YB36]